MDTMAATDFNDRIRFGSLYEIYGALLTEKQRQCLELYFCEDYSLAEVAEEMNVSRQAIHDLLKRVEQTLEHYEEMLGFLQRVEKMRMLTVEAEAILEKQVTEWLLRVYQNGCRTRSRCSAAPRRLRKRI